MKREAKKAQRERDRPNSTTPAQDGPDAKRQRLGSNVSTHFKLQGHAKPSPAPPRDSYPREMRQLPRAPPACLHSPRPVSSKDKASGGALRGLIVAFLLVRGLGSCRGVQLSHHVGRQSGHVTLDFERTH